MFLLDMQINTSIIAGFPRFPAITCIKGVLLLFGFSTTTIGLCYKKNVGMWWPESA